MEIRAVKVVAVGRLVGEPVAVGRTVHFRLQATPEGKPLHCFCEGRAAENFLKFRSKGDELTIEGAMEYVQFAGAKEPKLLIKALFTSYGRKRESLQPGDVRGGVQI